MGFLRNRLDDVRLAIMVLTQCPTGKAPLLPGTTLARAVWAYPLAGAAICAVSAGILIGATSAGLPVSVSVVLALAVNVLLSGALHEDGLADFCDGLGGGRDRDSKLAIMRDSRIGTYGAVALILSFLLRWSALTALAGQVGPVWIAAGALSRGAIAIPLCFLPAARSDGLGAQAASPPLWSALSAGVIAVAIAILLQQMRAVPMIAVALVSALLVTAMAGRYLRGHTGDVLGACALIAECLTRVMAGVVWV
jgi:adenosylcobinamide-GDP ribazoletransferase